MNTGRIAAGSLAAAGSDLLVGPAIGSRSRPQTLLEGLFRTARPKQWVKNVLVWAAPGAAGVALRADVTLPVLGAFVAWCLAASGAYFLNDAMDAEADRRHPQKQDRPVAAGTVPCRTAAVVGVALLAAGIGLPLAWGNPGVSALIGMYGAVTVSYSLGLKNQPVVDLAAVASGFVLRAVSGGVAAHVPISDWFLIVASFGSLFMVAGKRHAEYVDLCDDRVAHRATLGEYSVDFLRYVRSVSSSVAIAAYCLWAFEEARVAGDAVSYKLSIIPFVTAVLRYGLLVDAGHGGAPEDLVLGDRPLQIFGLVWLGLFATGVYIT